MRFLKYTILISITSLLFNCKRRCQDERADNYEEGPRKYTCDYGNADNWDKEIIIDSIVINGVKVELENVSTRYYSPSVEDNYYGTAGSRDFSAYIDSSKYLQDSIENISYTFSLPVASNFEITEVGRNQNGSIYYGTPLDRNSIFFREEGFNFLGEKELGEVKYYVYQISSDNLEGVELIKSNFRGSLFQMSIDYDVFSTFFEIDIDKL